MLRAGTFVSYLYYGIYTPLLTGLITVWSSSRLMEKPEQYATWSAIIIAMAIVNISSVTALSVYTKEYGWDSALLLAGPVLAFLGGVLGLSGPRKNRPTAST